MPILRPLLLGLLSLGLTLAARAEGVLEGRVKLPGAKTTPVMVKRYELVTKAGVMSTNPPLAVVYLEGNFPRPATAPVRQMAQKDFTFVPLLLAVQAGTKIEFPNQDDTYHNVFSYSPAKRFDLGRYRPDEKPVPVQTFDTPGLVTLRCDIHEHMRALILVVDTPHFVVTEPDGSFRLAGLPAGKYTLRAWIDSRTTLALPVEVTDGATTRADFP